MLCVITRDGALITRDGACVGVCLFTLLNSASIGTRLVPYKPSCSKLHNGLSVSP